MLINVENKREKIINGANCVTVENWRDFHTEEIHSP